MITKMKLEDLAEISSGQGAPQEESAFSDSGYPFIRAGNLESLLVSNNEYASCKLINTSTAQKYKLYLFPRNTIVFAKSGMSATKGRIYSLMNDSYIVNHLATVLPNPKLLHHSYLKYFLVAFSPSRLIKDSAYPSISLSDIKQIQIPLPPLEEQHRIVKILDLAQSLVEKRKQVIAYLDDYIKAVFLDMFGDPVSNPKGIKSLKGEELFRFSSGKFNPTKNLSQDYTFPTYGGNGITGFSQKYLIDYPTIVIGRVGAYCGSVHKILSKSWITDNAIFISKFKLKINLDFLYYQFIFLNFNRFSDFSGQPKITQKPLESTNYLFPDLVDQIKFSEIVQKTESLKQKMQVQLKELEDNFQAQLQKAFRGE